MTFLMTMFSYDGSVGEREMRALDRVRDVYGIRTVSVDETKRQIKVEYDASHLNQNDIAFMFRNAGIRLQ
jgi:hypothetical protein